MSNPGILKGRIYQAIFEHGPMTYEEMTRLIPDIRSPLFRQCIGNDKRRYAPHTNVFRIVGYRRNIGRKGDMSPIFGLGPGPDAPKPTPTAQEAGRRRDARNAIARAYKAAPERLPDALAALHRQHVEEANADCERAARVFANMFSPPPAPPGQLPRRVYKTPGG